MLLTMSLLGWAGCSIGQGFVEPTQFGWGRGDPDSTHYEWDDFSSASGDNAPDISADPADVAGILPNVIETTGTAFITSTGNIYSLNTVVEFEITVPAFELPGGTTDVVLQTRTQGREIDETTILANGQPPVETIELFRFELGPDDIFGGFLVDVVHRFEVDSSNPVVIEFAASDTSLSLDRVAVDTRTRESVGCPADVNGDGFVNPGDFNAWVIAFNTQAPECDQNGDGLCNPGDFNAWVLNFNSGC
ncbi:MAG: GC-type dockerin domain-anchored protein [Planctomycetota bacterium]